MNHPILKSFLLLILALPWFAECAEYPWLNENLSRNERVQALIDELSIEEKMAQLKYDAPAIPRLDIPPYNWWNEALHGVARNGRATVFPQPIGLAATFDDELAYRVASAVSDEARAKFNIAQSIGNYSRYAGLTFWTPNINIFRDPRWGRGMETYGEDPFLMARMGTAYARGLQGDDSTHLKSAACAKHFAVHSGPEALRHEFNAVPSRRDLQETYLPAFESLVREAEVECVMCAYNAVDGAPACANTGLLQDTLRAEWGFKGHVVSDCWAVNDFHDFHGATENAAQSAALALKSGTDLNCGSAFEKLPAAFEQSLISEQDIDRALSRLLNTRFKLGLFDESTAWDDHDAQHVESSDHVALALEAAQKSIVLLKNKNNVLPLDKNIRSLYVTGPQATNSEVLMGNYYGSSSDSINILDGIVGKVSVGTSVNYKYGQLPYQQNVNPIDWVSDAAKEAEAMIVVLGLSGLMEGEEGESVASPTRGDRLDLNLPKPQLIFLRKLRENNDKPIIVVLTGGSPMTIPEVDELADAVVWAWYPGQQGGNAVGDVLFGDVNPSGRLPITFPRSVDQLPPFEDYSMQGRGYRYMNERPLYPFGFGLSYTNFTYDKPRLADEVIQSGDPVTVHVSVRNNGSITGREVVQLYLKSDAANVTAPLSSLVGFKAVTLEPGQAESISFTINPRQMQVYDDAGSGRIVRGKHTLMANGVSPGERGEELTGRSPAIVQFTVQ